MLIEIYHWHTEEPLGRADMPHMPRVGEYLFLMNRASPSMKEQQSLQVKEVAYHVPNQNGGLGIPCTSGVVYVTPVPTPAEITILTPLPCNLQCPSGSSSPSR